MNNRVSLIYSRNSSCQHNATADLQVEAILDWLSPLNMYQKQQDILSRRHGNTGAWLLSNVAFQRWVNSDNSDRTLWCPGDREYGIRGVQ